MYASGTIHLLWVGGILWDNQYFNPAFLFVVAFTPAEQFKISKDGKGQKKKSNSKQRSCIDGIKNN